MDKVFECAKCFEFYSVVDDDQYVVSGCGHLFHKSCFHQMFEYITNWKKEDKRESCLCPIQTCKNSLYEEDYVILEGIETVKKKCVRFAMIVMGDMGVGKTSLIRKYTNGNFEHNSSFCTIGVEIYHKSMTIGEDNVQVTIFDTSGQEKYKQICSNFSRNTEGLILTYDTTCLRSLNNTEKWLAFYREYVPASEIILVGCRQDLEDSQQTCSTCKQSCHPPTELEIQKMAEKLGAFCHLKTSSKGELNIERSFKSLAVQILQSRILVKEARQAARQSVRRDAIVRDNVSSNRSKNDEIPCRSWIPCIFSFLNSIRNPESN